MTGKTPEETEREAQRQLVGKAIDMLAEHWDNVEIFVNRAATDGTEHSLCTSAGETFTPGSSRYGTGLWAMTLRSARRPAAI